MAHVIIVNVKRSHRRENFLLLKWAVPWDRSLLRFLSVHSLVFQGFISMAVSAAKMRAAAGRKEPGLLHSTVSWAVGAQAGLNECV